MVVFRTLSSAIFVCGLLRIFEGGHKLNSGVYTCLKQGFCSRFTRLHGTVPYTAFEIGVVSLQQVEINPYADLIVFISLVKTQFHRL